VPGIDGVGRGPDGKLRYFILPDTPMGAMAEQTVIDARRSVVLPDGTDPVAVAAAMNPGMSSWVGLRQRVDFQPGQKVLVLGAAGNAGQMAVQVAKLFGASQIIAAGRDAGKLSPLTALGATDIVALDGSPDAAARLGHSARVVDVVIDYLWGQPAADALRAIIPARADDGQQLTWLQIGSVAGATSPIPSAALRAARLQIVGSGQGSVSTRAILTELPALARAIAQGTFQVNARAVPLAGVEQAWADAAASSQQPAHRSHPAVLTVRGSLPARAWAPAPPWPLPPDPRRAPGLILAVPGLPVRPGRCQPVNCEAFGLDRMYFWHKQYALGAMLLLVPHILVTGHGQGYATASDAARAAQLGRLLGVISALGLLALVAVSFARISRILTLPYERWLLLHWFRHGRGPQRRPPRSSACPGIPCECASPCSTAAVPALRCRAARRYQRTRPV
jgi:NADPH:quinone reductase-like Zn-dependent oxidoreductase